MRRYENENRPKPLWLVGQAIVFTIITLAIMGAEPEGIVERFIGMAVIFGIGMFYASDVAYSAGFSDGVASEFANQTKQNANSPN